MDRLSFQVAEQLDYLQHTISPYIQSGSRIAKNAIDYASNQTSSAYSQIVSSNSGAIPFSTRLQWHWAWFLEHCSTWSQQFQQFISSHCHGFVLFTQSSFMVIEDKFNILKSSLSYRAFQHFIASVDQTHIYLFVSGIFIGFLIGIQFKQNLKPLTRMRALVCNSYKGAESISMTDDVIAPNSCGAEEVLIQVKASSIDPMDIKITLGYGKVIRSQYHHYNKAHGKNLLFPFVLGRECSGRILEIGSQVEDLDVGDEVYGAVPYYACGVASEIAKVPSSWVAKKPRKLSYEAAASLPYSASIVWNALVNNASYNEQNTAGKRILVHSADNPVGCIAVQLVKAWGGHVTATVCSRGFPTAQQLGADDLIIHDAQNDDFQQTLASREKFDLVLNTVGSFLHESCRSVCRDGGLIISTVASPPASDQYGILLGSLYSMWLRIQLLFAKGCGSTAISKQVLDEVSNLVNKGHIQPVIERVFEIDQAEQAGQYAAKGDTIGKIILRFRNRPLNRMDGFA